MVGRPPMDFVRLASVLFLAAALVAPSPPAWADTCTGAKLKVSGKTLAHALKCDASTTFQSVFTIGSGLPTTAGQTASVLPGLPMSSGPSPYGFLLLDRDAGV